MPKDPVSDTAVTGWAVRAFDAGDRAGIRAPKSSVAGARAFVEWVTGKSGGLVGYLDPDGAGLKVTGHHDEFDYHVGSMTALGIPLQLLADPKPDKATAAWLKTAVHAVLFKDPPTVRTPLAVDDYDWHQAAEAWSLLDSRGFEQLAEAGSPWRKVLVEVLMPLQSAASDKCSSGGWLAPDRWSYAAGPVYSTAVNLLSLERVEALSRD